LSKKLEEEKLEKNNDIETNTAAEVGPDADKEGDKENEAVIN